MSIDFFHETQNKAAPITAETNNNKKTTSQDENNRKRRRHVELKKGKPRA